MQDPSIVRSGDLSPAAKAVAESLLGRRLKDDEEVGIWASTLREAPTRAARQNGNLNRHIDPMASRSGEVRAKQA